MIADGRTSEMDHVPVIAGHELDVHLFQGAGSVHIPGKGALTAFPEDVTRPGGGRGGIGVDKCSACKEGNKGSVWEHREGYFGGVGA